MPVDVAKIKSGDNITVELVVSEARKDSIVAGPPDNPKLNWIRHSTIVGHTPKPPEIKAGMRFYCGRSSWDIVFVDENSVFFRSVQNGIGGVCSILDFRTRLNSGYYKTVDPS